ncbi:MAG: 30S ribosomal protein S16 [Sedimentisphaerales bacterium]|nr:30S ribosomal protein S16 [Sedimentisphaerales bacterium]
MAVKIRMTRMGRRHRPFFRINAIESRNPRDGRILEKLGHYDPLEKDREKQLILNIERIKYWLDNGAIPSDTISNMLANKGIKTKCAEEKAARRAKAKAQARTKGKLFNKAERIAAEKAAEAAKAAEEAAKKAEEEAKKAEEESAKKAEEAKAAEAEIKEEKQEEVPAEETPAKDAPAEKQKTEETPVEEPKAEKAEEKKEQ